MTAPNRACFVANWKMNLTASKALSYLETLESLINRDDLTQSQIILAPPFTALESLSTGLKKNKTGIELSAQNLHFEEAGAFTGEVSGEMLCEIGCQYVIIGHSERRSLFGETDETVRLKLSAALRAGLRPILCIGETLKDRRTGKTWDRVQGQLAAALSEIGEKNSDPPSSPMLIAYEPIWAIGTGETPTPEEVSVVHQEIKTFFTETLKMPPARVLYGGSVSPKNISDFMKESVIDGVLVGGASLSAESFHQLISSGQQAHLNSSI